MPKVELTYQQTLEAVKQLTSQEQQQLRVDLHPHPLSLEFTTIHFFSAKW